MSPDPQAPRTAGNNLTLAAGVPAAFPRRGLPLVTRSRVPLSPPSVTTAAPPCERLCVGLNSATITTSQGLIWCATAKRRLGARITGGGTTAGRLRPCRGWQWPRRFRWTGAATGSGGALRGKNVTIHGKDWGIGSRSVRHHDRWLPPLENGGVHCNPLTG